MSSDSIPKAKTGAWQTRYHPVSNPPPALREIYSVLIKRADRRGVLNEKPSIAIHGLRDYKSASWGPADDASRFLFRWHCVIPLDNGTWLLDKFVFQYVLTECARSRIPSNDYDVNERVAQILNNPENLGVTEQDETPSDMLTVPELLSSPEIQEMLEEVGESVGAGQPPTQAQLLREIDMLADENCVLMEQLGCSSDDFDGLRGLIQTDSVAPAVRGFLEDTVLMLHTVLQTAGEMTSDNNMLYKELESALEFQGHVDSIIAQLEDLVNQIGAYEREFDLCLERRISINAVITDVKTEAESLRDEIQRIDLVIAAFCKDTEAVAPSSHPPLDFLMRWRKRLRDIEETLATRRQKAARLANLRQEPEAIAQFSFTACGQLQSIASAHSRSCEQLFSWLELLHKSGFPVDRAPELNEDLKRLSSENRRLDQDIPEFTPDMAIPDLPNVLSEPAEELQRAVRKVQEFTRWGYSTEMQVAAEKPIAPEAAPVVKPDTGDTITAEKKPVPVATWETVLSRTTVAESTMVKRFVIALASVTTERVRRGRTFTTIYNHILGALGTTDASVSVQRLETLVDSLVRVRPQAISSLQEHGYVYYKMMDYGRTLADTWSQELGISVSDRKNMYTLIRQRDDQMYSETQYWAERRKQRNQNPS